MTASRSQDGYDRSSPDHADMDHQRRRMSPAITTPLLMPPPTTFLGEVRHRSVVAQHHTMLLLRQNAESAAFFVRLCLFLVKMVSLARPCWPYTVSWGIGASLVAVAGMDLGIPGSRGFAVPRRPSHGVAAAPFRWGWDWRVSAALVVIHSLVLAAASRWGVLCAARPDSWAAW